MRHFICTLLPTLTVIIINEIILMMVFLNLPFYRFIPSLIISQLGAIIGSLVIGHISDNYCRKKTLIVVQILGLIVVSMFFIKQFSLFTLAFYVLLFEPYPVARAAIIDNFPNSSKVKLIAASFVVQFLPWTLYSYLKNINTHTLIIFLFSFLLINLIVTTLLFKDKRDKSPHKIEFKGFKNKKIALTLIAFFCAQIVFFLSDIFIEDRVDQQYLLSALGIGTTIGILFSFFYTKIPHISVLTIIYALGVILSFVPLCATTFMPIQNINLGYQTMILSTIAGFYFPFIYDVIISACSSSHRGFACAIIEGASTIAIFTGIAAIILTRPFEKGVLISATILFLLATITQKFAEHKKA